MAHVEADVTQGAGANGQRATGDPSVSSSLEHLVAGSQGVITKRIDLALLEARELLSRTLRGSALLALAIVLMAAAWLAVTAGVVLLVIPDTTLVVRLAAFALLNGGTAVGLVRIAMRNARPPIRARVNGNAPTLERKLPTADGES